MVAVKSALLNQSSFGLKLSSFFFFFFLESIEVHVGGPCACDSHEGRVRSEADSAVVASV